LIPEKEQHLATPPLCCHFARCFIAIDAIPATDIFALAPISSFSLAIFIDIADASPGADEPPPCFRRP
jgi:hypothetical protein